MGEKGVLNELLFLYYSSVFYRYYIKHIIMENLLKSLGKFENWFNNNFGWFFVNGRKQSEKLKA